MGFSHHPIFLPTIQLNIWAKAQILGTVKKILSDPNLFVKGEQTGSKNSTSALKIEHLLCSENMSDIRRKSYM